MLVASSRDEIRILIYGMITVALSPCSECQEVVDNVNKAVMDTKIIIEISIISSITVDN